MADHCSMATKKKQKAAGKKSVRSGRKKASKSYRAVEAQTGRAGAVVLVESSRGGKLLRLRSRLGLNRETFARLLPVSTRSLASIEHGESPSPPVTRRLTEICRVVDALSEVIEEDAVGRWMLEPNDAFDGLKPIEVIERGEIDRIWRMVYLLRSGVSA
jgi:transcriptional regulator with XRE-family HTH domain